MTVVLSDAFTGADAAEINGRTPDAGSAWIATGGAGKYEIRSNQANYVAGGGGVLISNAGVADNYTLTCFIKPLTTAAGIMFRSNVGASEFLMARWNGTSVEIYTFAPGATQIGSLPGLAGTPSAAGYTIVVTVAGTAITATVNAVQAIATSSVGQTNTYAGLRGSNGATPTGDRFDDFSFDAVTATAAKALVNNSPLLSLVNGGLARG